MLIFLDIKDIFTVGSVSSKMRELALSALSFKKSWSFSNYNRITFNKLTKTLEQLPFNPMIKSLRIVSCINIARKCVVSKCLKLFLQNVTKLTIIDSCDEDQLGGILSCCPKLVHIYTDVLDDEGVECLPLKNISTLRLKGCSKLTKDGMSGLFKFLNLHSKTLLTLSFSHLSIEPIGYLRLASSIEIEVEEELTIALEILSCKTFDSSTATDFFRILKQNFLIVIKSVKVNGTPLRRSVFKHLCQMTDFDGEHVDFCESEECLEILSNSSETLERFALRHPANLKLLNLAKVFNCTKLKKISLPHCSSIVDNNFLKLLASKCKALEWLDLDSCHSISTKSLKIVALFCTKLKHINLSRCELVNDEDLKALLLSVGARLNTLKIRGCYRVTSNAVMAISVYCCYIEHLDVSWCFQVNGLALSAISSRCRRLKTLFFNGIAQISDLEEDNIYQLSYRLSYEKHKRLIRQKSSPRLRMRRQRSASMIPSDAVGFHLPENENVLNRRIRKTRRKSVCQIENEFVKGMKVDQEEIKARLSLFNLSLQPVIE